MSNALTTFQVVHKSSLALGAAKLCATSAFPMSIELRMHYWHATWRIVLTTSCNSGCTTARWGEMLATKAFVILSAVLSQTPVTRNNSGGFMTQVPPVPSSQQERRAEEKANSPTQTLAGWTVHAIWGGVVGRGCIRPNSRCCPVNGCFRRAVDDWKQCICCGLLIDPSMPNGHNAAYLDEKVGL